jgi:hypothetical protein
MVSVMVLRLLNKSPQGVRSELDKLDLYYFSLLFLRTPSIKIIIKNQILFLSTYL